MKHAIFRIVIITIFGIGLYKTDTLIDVTRLSTIMIIWVLLIIHEDMPKKEN